MKKQLLTLICLAAIMAFSFIGIYDSQKQKWQPLDNVVKLEVTGIYGDTWEGTGFFVADDLVMTAGHMVQDANEIKVIWSKNYKRPSYSCYKDWRYWTTFGLFRTPIQYKEPIVISWYQEPEADIGIVYIRTLEVEQNLDFDKAKLGEDCWAIGNPYGEYPILNKGTVSAIEAPDTFLFQKDMIVVDCPLHPGNSGCPIFDMDNNVLGVCSWGYSPVMTYCVRAEVCKMVLEKYLAIKALEEVE